MANKALGKGLGALIKKTPGATGDDGDGSPEGKRREVRQVALDEVVPSPLQPRHNIPDGDLDEMVDSIRQHGVIQPLIVRAVDGKLELIAGERRWRACQRLDLEHVPVIEREATDREVLEMALVENLQRQDLNAIEEAAGYARLAKEFGMKQDEIAQRVGKSRAAVANSIRLLDLQVDVQKLLADGHLTVGHSKAILGIKEKKAQLAVAEEVLRRKLTVRQTEKLVQELQSGSSTGGRKNEKTRATQESNAAIKSITNRLRNHFATHVSISHSAKKGRIELEYYGEDDLTRILEMMGVDYQDL